MTADRQDWLAAAHSGVYRAPMALGPLREAAAASQCAWIDIDLGVTRDKGGLLKLCAAALAFPPTFGANWDAFSDCLQDLSWRSERGYVLHLGRADVLAQAAPTAWATALEILGASATYWKNRGRPFIVLAGGDAGLPEFVR